MRWRISASSLGQPTAFARSVRKLRPGSDRAVVVPQQSAQPLTATHVGAPEGASLGCDQLVAEPLMVPLPMGVRHELAEGVEQVTFPEEGSGGRGTPRGSSARAVRASAPAEGRAGAAAKEAPFLREPFRSEDRSDDPPSPRRNRPGPPSSKPDAGGSSPPRRANTPMFTIA